MNDMNHDLAYNNQHDMVMVHATMDHSHLFPLLDVLYRQVGNLTFWTVICTELPHSGQ